LKGKQHGNQKSDEEGNQESDPEGPSQTEEDHHEKQDDTGRALKARNRSAVVAGTFSVF
jgi:hypothetical protein